MKYSYRTEGTCCQAFDIETEDGKIKDCSSMVAATEICREYAR